MANDPETKDKDFDCVASMREVRDAISAEIAGMSAEELRRWFKSREYSIQSCAGSPVEQSARRASTTRTPSERDCSARPESHRLGPVGTAICARQPNALRGAARRDADVNVGGPRSQHYLPE